MYSFKMSLSRCAEFDLIAPAVACLLNSSAAAGGFTSPHSYLSCLNHEFSHVVPTQPAHPLMADSVHIRYVTNMEPHGFP